MIKLRIIKFNDKYFPQKLDVFLFFFSYWKNINRPFKDCAYSFKKLEEATAFCEEYPKTLEEERNRWTRQVVWSNESGK
jgi:hypothetical protein